MEEKSRYFSQKSAINRSIDQCVNDFDCIRYLAKLAENDGNVKKTRLKPLIDFYYGNKAFAPAPNSRAMKANLIHIKDNWVLYKNSPIINAIANFYTITVNKTVSETNTNSIFRTVEDFYRSGKSTCFFQIDNLLQDLCSGRFKNNIEMEERVVDEFNTFVSKIQIESGCCKNEGESDQ